jgi:hypothetical protein
MVNYGEQESTTQMALLEKIVSIYGKFDDRDEETKSLGNGYSKETTFTRYYRNDFVFFFVLFEYYNSRYYNIGSASVCYYQNPQTITLINNERRKKESEKLSL